MRNWRLWKCVIQRWQTIAGSSIVTLCNINLSTTAQSPLPAVKIPPNTTDAIEPTIPLLSASQPTPAQAPEINAAPKRDRFSIKKVQVLGSTVLHSEIAALIKPYENREVTFEELIGLRSAITQVYIQNGYVTSGAFLPNNQSLNNGVVQIQVVEGELERIELSGLKRLQEGYVRKRLEIASKSPINRQRLEKALQLLQLDPLLEQVNAELTVGNAPGRSILKVRLKEAPAFHAGIAIENRQSPSIGSVQTNLFVVHDNLSGRGDRFSATYGITRGLDSYDINYTIPLSASNTTLLLRYSNSDSRIVEDAFRNLNIRGDTQTVSFGIRHPLVRSPENELALGLALDLRRSQTYLLKDIPFSFSAGAENGKSKVTVIRFSQDWVKRKPRQVLAARSQFSLGVDVNATINDSGTDGRFFSWLGQLQLVQELSKKNVLLIRIDTQLTPDSLLTPEQFSIGGMDTVRGYRQNQTVADNGILGSVEVRFPLTSNPEVLQVAPFFDIGKVWNNQNSAPDITTIASLGLGVRWLIQRDLSLRLDYGIPLTKIENQGNSLQDNGLYFSLRYQPF
ncbi:MAG TPA: ShlB/FhaC/HecB family hemolysin secretion/activation protein [Cyanobacteria bacterium UBA11049]|nr:ShlB/FhaC/HecB family hemolysin secretion/activation protein [Cyanobacteria bacterium UBA11049]